MIFVHNNRMNEYQHRYVTGQAITGEYSVVERIQEAIQSMMTQSGEVRRLTWKGEGL